VSAVSYWKIKRLINHSLYYNRARPAPGTRPTNITVQLTSNKIKTPQDCSYSFTARLYRLYLSIRTTTNKCAPWHGEYVDALPNGCIKWWVKSENPSIFNIIFINRPNIVIIMSYGDYIVIKGIIILSHVSNNHWRLYCPINYQISLVASSDLANRCLSYFSAPPSNWTYTIHYHQNKFKTNTGTDNEPIHCYSMSNSSDSPPIIYNPKHEYETNVHLRQILQGTPQTRAWW
jgi:hypothetical protein